MIEFYRQQTQNALIASATFQAPEGITKAQLHAIQQKQARNLLARYQKKEEVFCETDYPYRLLGMPSRFVSFSHSGNRVALIAAPVACGIDIETKPISQLVAKRFFHPNELEYIASIPTHQQSDVRCLLWQIKESMVKLTGSTLSQLISQDMTEYAQTLIKSDIHQWIKHTSTANTDYLLWHAHQIVAIQAVQTA